MVDTRELAEKLAKEGNDEERKDAKKMLEILDKYERQAPQDWKTRRQAMYRKEYKRICDKLGCEPSESKDLESVLTASEIDFLYRNSYLNKK